MTGWKRIEKSVAGIRTEYYYDGMQLVETRTNGVANEQFVYDSRYLHSSILRDRDIDGDGDCADAGGSERLYYVNDANFNMTALVSVNGAVVERYTYDPYGAATIRDAAWQPISWDSSRQNVILYTGHKLDRETGLYYSLYRYYHPGLGRWASRDPLLETRENLALRGILGNELLERHADGYGRRLYSPSLDRWLNKDLFAEAGGVHVYLMCRNNPANAVDLVGNVGASTGEGNLADEGWGVGPGTDPQKCGVVIWLTHAYEVWSSGGIGGPPKGVTQLKFPEGPGCRRAAIMSCHSAEKVPYLLELLGGKDPTTGGHLGTGKYLVPLTYQLAPGRIGNVYPLVDGENLNANEGEGVAGFVKHFLNVVGKVKQYAVTLCPPKEWLDDPLDPCRSCRIYREKAGIPGEMAYDYDRFTCCHCRRVFVKFQLPFVSDFPEYLTVSRSRDWLARGGWNLGQKATYNCERQTWE